MTPPPSEAEVLGYFSALSNAAAWGPADQLGTLNYVTNATRAAAAGLVRDGTTVSCSALIAKGQVAADVPYPPLHFMIRSGETRDRARPGAVEFLGLVFHGLTTTHVDALGHSMWEGQVYGGRDSAVITGERGATELSVDVMKAGIVTRAVLLDIAALKGKPYLAPGTPIHPADLEAAEARAGCRLAPGDALLIRTGWWAYRSANGPQADRSRPGLHASTLPWLHERQVAMVASDAANDVVPSGYPSIEQPVHEIGQVAMGLCLIDVCDFDALAAACEERRRWEFLFVVAPLRIEYGTGSPVNPLAIF